MVIIQITRRLDDLDGSELGDDPRPLTFALEGTAYEIDLSHHNAQKLRDLLQPFTSVARVIDVGASPVTRAVRTEQRREIREWARAHNLMISDRGRISDAVLNAYARRDSRAAA